MENIEKVYLLADFRQLSLTDFVDSCFQIQCYCRGSVNEKCGITTNMQTHIVKNQAKEKKNSFCMDPNEYYDIYTSESIQFIWHSHPSGDATPSQIDIEMCQEHQYNCVIFSKKNKNFSLYRFDLPYSVYFSI